MDTSSWFGAGGDGERLFCGRWRDGADGEPHAVLTVLPAAEHPTPDSLNRLTHEYVLKDDLDGTWATRPQRLVRAGVRIMLTLGFLGGPGPRPPYRPAHGGRKIGLWLERRGTRFGLPLKTNPRGRDRASLALGSV